MDVFEKKISEVQHLVQDKGYGYKEAINQVKYELDGDKLYDPRTEQIICDIEDATNAQIRNLLR